MLFSVVIALMVILVAAFWTYQGFFSSVIMFFDSLVAAMLAFAFFEGLHGLWGGADSMRDEIGLPLALMLIFCGSLLVMRIITDKLIPTTISFPLPVERAGGAVAGLFTGLILVGSALVSIQMLPLGSGVLGFERWEMNQRTGLPVENGLAMGLNPDAFVVSLAGLFSGDSRFGGGNPFANANPDYLQQLYSMRATPQTEARVAIPKDCLRVQSYWDCPQIDHVTQQAPGGTMTRAFSSHEPAGRNTKFLACTVRLYAVAAPEDRAGQIRFRVPQFRLVGPRPNKDRPSARPKVHLACGMSDIYTHKDQEWSEVRQGQAARLVRFSPLTDMILSPSTAKEVAKVSGGEDSEKVEFYEFDVVFEVDNDPDFEPWYLDFKRGARAELTKQLKLDAAPGYVRSALASGGGSSSGAPASGDRPVVSRASKGRVHRANAIEERTGVSDALPMPLDGGDRVVSRCLRGGKLQEGHFWVVVPEEEIDPDARVTEFLVPSGKRMVQIGAEEVFAGSTFGNALNYAAAIAAQIKLHTADGRTYFAQGVYSMGPVGSDTIFEIQYWPDPGIPERCLKKAKKLTRSIMKNVKESERKFGYIFLVDPGVKITGFSAGQRSRTPQKVNIDVPG